MWQIGIDLHRRFVVLSAVDDSHEIAETKMFERQDTDWLIGHVRRLEPFRGVIEATQLYHWLVRIE